MILEIKIPSPGESITEAQLAVWFVKDGDYVEKNKELAEIESDKATLPLIAGESGKIKILVAAGETVAIGAVACSIDTGAAKPENTDTPEIKKPESQKPVPPAVSNTTKAGDQKGETAKVAAGQPPQTIQATPPKTSDAKADPAIKVSPVAKTIMEAANLSVEDIISGLRRIGKTEVETVINALKQQPENGIPVIHRDETRKQMSPLRKKLGERLVAVKNQTAMLTTFNEVDMSAVMELRKKYQKEFEAKYGFKVGFMSFFTKAVSEALRLHPNVNSMIDGDDIVTPGYYDIAIAVQTDKGLMVPVLRNVETLSIAAIEKGIADLAVKARSGRISLEEMTGGTFTITNGGVFGSLLSTPIINPPQSAILGMHNIVERPVAVNGSVIIRPMMYIALSYDHRVIDGKDSVGFLVHVKQFIENPARLLFNGDDPEKILLDL